MEKPVSFINKNGKKIFGIVHVPEQDPKKNRENGINLLNPGIKYRVAPNRLNVKLARELCNKGFYVFRFDPEGIGDSEGELPGNVPLKDIFEIIQKGHFVSDTIECNDFISKEFGLKKLILIGNCGGAISSIFASSIDKRIEKLCLIDVPINLRSSNTSFTDRIVEGGKRSEIMLKTYTKKIWSLNAWIRFFSFKSNFNALWKILVVEFKKRIHLFNKKKVLPGKIEELCNEGKLNRRFFESFTAAMSRRVPILFILAENDSGADYFKHYFQDNYLREKFSKGDLQQLIEIYQVDNANHVYTLPDWQDLLISKIGNWLI